MTHETPAPARDARPEKIYLLSSVCNEGPYILEFVAHHLVLGFSRILIASNDCDDGSVRVLRALRQAGYIDHLENRLSIGDKPQHSAYRKLRARFDVDEADWVMVLDIDEFLNVHVGDHSVQALTRAAPEGVQIIALNSATFGSDGRTKWTPGLVTDQFRRRLPAQHRASGPVKSLTRGSGAFRQIHAHSLVDYQGPPPLLAMLADGQILQLDLGQPLWAQLRHFKPGDVSFDMAQYNHYAVKTPDAFRLRAERPRPSQPLGTPNDRYTEAYFQLRAAARLPDQTIQRYARPLREKIADMMRDPEIAAAQTFAERRYARKLAQGAALPARR